jgi:hypothetical protein
MLNVEIMLGLVSPPDVLDPRDYMAAAIALFAKYPEAVMRRAAFEVPQRSDRPTLRLMREVLDELYEPVAREIERRRAAESSIRGLPPPDAKRSPEQQARIDLQVARVRAELHIPDWRRPQPDTS